MGALICEKFAAEGANVMCNYVSAEDRAKEVQRNCEKHGVKAFIIQGVRCATPSSAFADYGRTPAYPRTTFEW